MTRIAFLVFVAGTMLQAQPPAFDVIIRGGKSSWLPASTIGMSDRGLIAAGMAADITVFDPNTIIDHATYENPALPSEGVKFVLVNGVVALKNGAATGAREATGTVKVQGLGPVLHLGALQVADGWANVRGSGTVTSSFAAHTANTPLNVFSLTADLHDPSVEGRPVIELTVDGKPAAREVVSRRVVEIK